MILYHGSNQKVDNPKLLIPNRYLDFGTGFYTTSNYKQAKNFALKVRNRFKKGEAVVNIYEINEECFNKLKVLSFSQAGEDWLNYVSDNRNGKEINDYYDIVCGPVANDDIYRTFSLYESGILTKEQTLEALMVKKLYNQYVFKTMNGLQNLKYVKMEIINHD